MFPFVYGFSWSTGTLIFLGTFFSVLTIVFITVVWAARNTRRTLSTVSTGDIRWNAEFKELPSHTRYCRHHVLSTARGRLCPHAFSCDVCPDHLRFRERESALSLGIRPGVTPDGFRLPLDRYYHRGHTWVRSEEDGTLLVGVDDLVRRLFSQKPDLILPEVGARVRRNDTLFSARHEGETYRFTAPVGGTVTDVGDSWGGWLLRLRSDQPVTFTHLLAGDEVTAWIQTEFELIQNMLGCRDTGPMLADGGTPVENLPQALPKAPWDSIRGTVMFDI